MVNLNLLFNKSYFKGIGDVSFKSDLETRNTEIFSTVFSPEPYPQGDYREIADAIAPQHFLMKTNNPGMLVGTGYSHEAEQGSDACIKLGFSFDYVTGQPYIPGSSVKGMLRSCFRQREVIREVMKVVLKLEDTPADQRKLLEGSLRKLEESIFDGKDIFFDAVLASGDRSGHIVGSDYITPHGADETKDPIPLLMVKILPEVVFEFRFKLHNSIIVIDENDPDAVWTVSSDEKKKVFAALLEIFGIGAKTNVGYGTLTFIRESVKKEAKDQKEHCIGNNNKCSNSREPGELLCKSCKETALKNGKCAMCKTAIGGKGKGKFAICPKCGKKYKK